MNGNEVAFTFNTARTNVITAAAPMMGSQNVRVLYARDPFPDYTWNLNFDVAVRRTRCVVNAR